ncbi:hypothetical protein HK101_006180, partial [Irineochytrium annulatum]
MDLDLVREVDEAEEEGEVKVDGTKALPFEIRVKILTWLDARELILVAQVSKDWRLVAFDGNLWTELDLSRFNARLTTLHLTLLCSRSARFLRTLNLRGCINLTTLEPLPTHNPNVTSLTLLGCRSLPPLALQHAISPLQRLTRLILAGLPAVTDALLPHLATKPLVHLDLSSCARLTQGALVEGVGGIKTLEVLRVSHVAAVGDEFLRALWVKGVVGLKTLDVSCCARVSDVGLRAFSGLEGVGVPGVTSSTEPLLPPTFRGRPTLTRLSLSSCPRLTDLSLSCLAASCMNLKTLELASLPHVTDEGLKKVIRGCAGLAKLDLEECAGLGDESVECMQELSELRWLALSYCTRVSEDAVESLLRSCHTLSHLELDNCPQITDTLLRRLSRRPALHLRNLELYDCRGVSHAAIRELDRGVERALRIASESGDNADGEQEGEGEGAEGTSGALVAIGPLM